MVTWYDEDYDDDYDDWDDDEEESGGWDSMICTPQNCGECWGGDGLCMREIEAMATEHEEFHKKYVSENIECPHCKARLTRYQIPTTELWTWPGVWPGGVYYSPMIALGIFAVMDAPKGEVHPPADGRFYTYHHIWVGEGEYRDEKLIMLDKKVVPVEETVLEST